MLLLDAPNFRLLDKDWVGGAQAVAQKGHDMMHGWLFAEADQGHADGGHFYEAMVSGERAQLEGARGQTNPVTLQHSTTPQAGRRGYAPPCQAGVEGQTPDEERDDRIRELVRGFIKRWRSSGHEGAVKMNEAPGGKKYGPELGTLLPPGALRTWLEGEDQFEIVDYADGSWGVQMSPSGLAMQARSCSAASTQECGLVCQ